MLPRILLCVALIVGLPLVYKCFKLLEPREALAEFDFRRMELIQTIQIASLQQKQSWFFKSQPFEVELDDQVGLSGLNKKCTLRFRLLQFDPGAVVAILPGLDGKPGVAGVDDNGNGQTDERIELGATQSDDRCLAMNGDVAQAMNPRPLILQRGAFVPVASPTDLVPDTEQRLEVKVEQQLDSPGARFSFLITDRKPFILD